MQPIAPVFSYSLQYSNALKLLFEKFICKYFFTPEKRLQIKFSVSQQIFSVENSYLSLCLILPVSH